MKKQKTFYCVSSTFPKDTDSKSTAPSRGKRLTPLRGIVADVVKVSLRPNLPEYMEAHIRAGSVAVVLFF